MQRLFNCEDLLPAWNGEIEWQLTRLVFQTSSGRNMKGLTEGSHDFAFRGLPTQKKQ